MTFVTHHRHHCRSRRGVGTLLAMVFLSVFIMLLVLVLNYTHLAYSQLRTGEVTDTLARIAARELLDEELLEVGGALSQGDDVTVAKATVGDYLAKLNALAADNQQLRYDSTSSDPQDTDIIVTPGWVEDVSQSVTDGSSPLATFLTTPPANTPFNTLKVEASRPVDGGNPLYLFVRSAFAPEAAQVGTKSFVSLDSRLIGFQPTPTRNVPLAPIAIDANQWAARPAMTNIFSGLLKESDGMGPTNNIVLLNFNEDQNSFDANQIEDLLYDGVGEADISIDDGNSNTPPYFLGPVVEGSANLTLTLSAEDRTPSSQAQAIADALNDISSAPNRVRIFPLYDPTSYSAGNQTVKVIGFVAAEVIGADYDDTTPADDRLTIELRPQFLIHPTAMTSRVYDDGMTFADVPENVYIHKLRLSR